MKAILISINPKWVAKILNGEKTIEIRKTCPEIFKRLKPYEGCAIDVYIYCTKGKSIFKSFGSPARSVYTTLKMGTTFYDMKANGKVVAKFTLKKVEEIKYHFGYYDMGEWTESYILENACLSAEELNNYLQASKEYDEKKVSRVYGYAWHIDNLVPFDKPKDIREFTPYCELCGSTSCCNCKHAQRDSELRFICCDKIKPLTRAPQLYCFIEV